MPSQVTATPIRAAATVARPGLRVIRRAMAAGPTSSAVDRMVPTVSADSDTASAMASRQASPTARTRMPRAAARSALTELSSSGRYSTTTMARATAPQAITSGTTVGLSVNMEPNKIVTAAPVAAVCVVSQYSSSAAIPSPAPRTIPVARSRPRGRRIPIMSITPAASTPVPAKPSSGLMPSR